MKRRIAQIFLMTAKGGGEVWIATLLPYLQQSQDMNFCFISHNQQPNYLASCLAASGQSLYVAPSRFNLIGYVYFFFRFFRQYRIDIVHTHIYLHSSLVLLAAWLAGVPVRIMHNHAAERGCGASALSVWRLYRAFCRFLINLLATHILYVSQAALADIKMKFFAGRTAWLPPSVLLETDEEKNLAPAPSFEDVSARGSERTRFACIGRIHKSRFFGNPKNQLFLVEVARELLECRDFLDFHIYIIGEGNQRAEIEQRVREVGVEEHFTFTGQLENVAHFLSEHVDAVLAPSNHEGFGMAVLEAQLLGLPVLISEHVPPEAVVNNNLVEQVPLADGAAAWATAMMRLRERLAVMPEGERTRQRSLSLTRAHGSIYDPACNAHTLLAYYQNYSEAVHV